MITLPSEEALKTIGDRMLYEENPGRVIALHPEKEIPENEMLLYLQPSDEYGSNTTAWD